MLVNTMKRHDPDHRRGAQREKFARDRAGDGISTGKRRFFVATAEARDDEMAASYRTHHEAAPGRISKLSRNRFTWVRRCKARQRRADVVVLDCLTLWVANLMDRDSTTIRFGAAAERLAQSLTACALRSRSS